MDKSVVVCVTHQPIKAVKPITRTPCLGLQVLSPFRTRHVIGCPRKIPVGSTVQDDMGEMVWAQRNGAGLAENRMNVTDKGRVWPKAQGFSWAGCWLKA